MTNWSLLTVRVAGADVSAVRLEDGTVVAPEELRPYPGLRAVIDDWANTEAVLRTLEPAGLPPLTEWSPTATIRYPGKLLGVGANYSDHMAEMGAPPAPEDAPPFFFTVPVQTSMIGDGETILVPPGADVLPDWEAELAVVIGKRGRFIDAADALEYVAGYSSFSDITARGWMRRAKPLADPFTYDWAACKGTDTFCPMGAMTPAWQVGDPNSLSIRCLVSDVVKQDGTTKNFMTNVEHLIAAASQFWTLEPGDVIATGTPAGVGHAKGEYLTDGDVVRVEIESLAPLVNPVRFMTASRNKE